MSKKGTLIFLNLMVLGLIGLITFGFAKIYVSQKGQQAGEKFILRGTDKYAYLTTGNLSSLPPLPETLKIEPTGQTKEFTLEAKESQWEVLPGVKTKAVTYNGNTPGPVIRVTEGDLVRITLKNNLKAATSIHFHGMHLPNKQDGVPPFTQKSVEPGESFTYEFIAGHAGTYMYHPHINSVEQIDQGLYGAFIIDPQDKSGYPRYDKEYTMVLAGWNIPSDSFDPGVLTGEQAVGEEGGHGNMEGMEGMEESSGEGEDTGSGHDGMEGMEGTEAMEEDASGSMAMDYNFWTINGKAFPATEKLKVKEGERVMIRLINISNQAHPMHLHGTDFRIIAEDSHPLARPQIVNTINVAPGKTFDIEFIADNPGQWVFHCHELHHTENDGVEPGGLMTVIEYEGSKPAVNKPQSKSTDKSDNTSSHNSMGGMQH